MAQPAISLTIRAARDLFFDAETVKKAVDGNTRKALVPIGAKIRTQARRSMRPARRMKPSELPPELRKQYEQGRNKKGRFNAKRKELPFKSSRPGEPPRTRKSKNLRNLLFFQWDPQTKSVVAGPAKWGQGEAPSLLERGGQSTIRAIVPPKSKRPKRPATPAQLAGLQKARQRGKLRTRSQPVKVTRQAVRIQPRPFMRPQLDATLPTIPQQFKGLID